VEIDAAGQVSARISDESASCDIIIITHYHHDHFTPFYEHAFSRVPRSIYDGKKVYAKSWLENINRRQEDRAARFLEGLGPDRHPQICDGLETGALVFSPAFPHGEKELGIFVVMVAIRAGSGVFVHGSDIQSVEPEAVDWIIAMRPDVAFVSGPPIYLPQVSPAVKDRARENIARMTRTIPTLIVDHHMARGLDCETFLRGAAQIAAAPGHRLTLASRYMNREPMLLEARRKMLYREKRTGGDGGGGGAEDVAAGTGQSG